MAADQSSPVLDNGNARPVNPKGSAAAPPPHPTFPPPKTDKPRPHVCGTCARSFARLEHLKRHERSHTKEKPFECPECTRCFARRDLLLRHQQKLHINVTPSSRPRNGRRESAGSVAASGPGRVRKNSVAGSTVGRPPATSASMTRPRANTISHVDGSTLGMISAGSASTGRGGNMGPMHSHHASLSGLPGSSGFDFRGMSNDMGHGPMNGLTKLDTQGPLGLELGGGLRTAPPFGGFAPGFEMDSLSFGGPNSTINPAQLHFNDAQTFAMVNSNLPFYNFPVMPAGSALFEDDDNFDWMSGFDNQLSFSGANEQAVGESSPSAISTASQGGLSEVMLDGSNNPSQSQGNMWSSDAMMPPAPVPSTTFSPQPPTSAFAEMISPPGTVSPRSLHGREPADHFFATPPPIPSGVPGMANHPFHPHPMLNPDTPSTSSASVSGSARQSSITSVSSESITDATRQALLASLSQPSQFHHNHQKYSAAANMLPLSPGFATSPLNTRTAFPSTKDLQRYVAAYIQYFHPHLPFLHVATLSFDSPAFTSDIHSARAPSGTASGVTGGGGCLVLAMSAIGALYEFEPAASRELFEASKQLLQIYLEESRKADVAANNAAQNTPLWLVQAMLLNVIYGINCGDKVAQDSASTHCAALVSLARAAELAQPLAFGSTTQSHPLYQMSPFSHRAGSEDLHMGDDGMSDSWHLGAAFDMPDDHVEWVNWKTAEERKRTFYAIFVLSSLLVAAYNRAPALTNSEILLDLPCDEDVWSAQSAQAWSGLGGARLAEQKAVTFSNALGSLLSASQRPMPPAGLPSDHLPESMLKPSAFGCLVLINALHNYLWETRQRHAGRQWTTHETEAMHAHIEPALKAWQAAWASDPHHSLERPNPFGRSGLSADCVPLLDLAYVRLFVNLGRSKEAFWQRDFDAMAHELAQGSDVVQHVEHSPSSVGSVSDLADSYNTVSSSSSPAASYPSPAFEVIKTPTPHHPLPSLVEHDDPVAVQSKRERHLRKAACYAADSMSISDKLNVTFGDFTSRELPLQSAMCAFDCAQVLAEWVSTLQERVGRFIGVLGKDPIDYGQVPAVFLLEAEDCKLLDKIAQIIQRADAKTNLDLQGRAVGNPSEYGGYAPRILRVTARMLDRAGVWPVTHLKAQALETHAIHMTTRAEKSVLAIAQPETLP
ncbi:MAG: hypothetical protein M1838_001192 [Thelocarpon superellum]|nr:MAG: hypothetical protein M1838_001192 [Thelocarpon superellum]